MPPKPIPYKCESCGHQMNVPHRYGGLEQKCRKCGVEFVVPTVDQSRRRPQHPPGPRPGGSSSSVAGRSHRDESRQHQGSRGSLFSFFKYQFASESPPGKRSTDHQDRPFREQSSIPSRDTGEGPYFNTLMSLQEAISNRQYGRAAQLTLENLRQIPGMVSASSRSYGSFDIQSMPALEQGGTMLALAGNSVGLEEMRGLIASVNELTPWADAVDRHEQDLRMFTDIVKAVEENPGCLQTGMKALIGADDGRRVANLLSWLEKAGRIARTKHKRTYKLNVPGHSETTSMTTAREAQSHRKNRNHLKINEINITSLPYIPLPRAPLKWEESQAGNAPEPVPEATDFFEVHGTSSWRVERIEKIPVEGRPDTAFRRLHPIDTGLFMIDDLGNAEGLGEIEAAALRFDRGGTMVAKTGLAHDVYRVGVNALGRGLVALSKDCVVHAYDDRLQPILETSCRKAPEVQALQRRLEIGDGELKNHLRCVALSRDHSRYLLTGVDEAWCIDIEGNGIWGAKLPLTEGWEQVSSPSQSFGTSREVDLALKVMGLSLPITPEETKRRYLELAKRWHPDLNPGDPGATERMKALIGAAELLTGVDAASLPAYTGATFARDIRSIETVVGGHAVTMNLGMFAGEKQAADWIYSAAFSGQSHSAFLAGYSGRVIQVDETGRGVRAYDIGAVPRRIIDTGDFLYFLTDTRLYVLSDESLHALVDTFDGGELVMAQTGFGLLEKKRFRWFREDGAYQGSVVTKNPIRRVYYTPDGMVVETRQRRALIKGAPGWWE